MQRFSYSERDYAFGQAMLSLRTAIGLTQTGLAELLGVSRKAVSRWEAGDTHPKAEHLKALLAFAVRQQAFAAGREEEEIRAFWRAAHQKVLLDERWLQELLGTQHPRLTLVVPQHVEETSNVEQIMAPSVPEPRVDWSDALAVPSFYGRTGEVAMLTQWVVEEHCRVVSVLGLGGIGKSALAWSPDGRLLASGGLDGGIRLWEVRGAQPEAVVRVFTGHTDWVFALAFAPDGRTLASGSFDRTLKLWDVESRRARETLTGHTDKVRAIAWSPDGRILASCGFDQTTWLWDVERGSYRMALQGHTAADHGLAFTPDSRILLSGSDDGTLRVWDVASGQCVHILQGYAVSLYDVAWSPDGTQLASAGSDTLVTVWEVERPMPPRLLRGHSWIVHGVAWSPDGRLLASCG